MAINISIFTTNQGHTSIAQAIKNHLRHQNFKVFVNHHQGEESIIFNSIYSYFPKLFKVPYKLGDLKTSQNILNKYTQTRYHNKITKQLKLQQPHLIISTWFLLNQILESYASKTNTPLINILANPRTFHHLETSPHAFNFVFDQTALKRCQNFNTPAKKIITSGWFVQDQFKPTNNKHQLKKSLGLHPNKLTFLIVGGSQGTIDIFKIFPALFDNSQPIQIIHICGTNKQVHAISKALSKIITRLNKKTTIKVISFTKQIHRYLQIADITVGKAGPNLIFESVATHTPFLATTHITGHEDGNLDIIKQYNLGFIQEDVSKIIKLFNQITSNPKILDRFTPKLTKLAQHNQQSRSILTQFITKRLNLPTPKTS